MTEDLSSNDMRQEGRLSAIEVKVDHLYPMVEEIHADMLLRKQGYAALKTFIKFMAWAFATFLAVIGLRNNAVSVWLHATTGIVL